MPTMLIAMKEIKKQILKTVKYQCEICKETYFWKEDAENCEKSHNCEHEPYFEFRQASNDSWWFNVSGIDCQCKNCKYPMGDVSFEDIEDNQEILKRIFNAVKSV